MQPWQVHYFSYGIREVVHAEKVLADASKAQLAKDARHAFKLPAWGALTLRAKQKAFARCTQSCRFTRTTTVERMRLWNSILSAPITPQWSLPWH
jgi:hypothetical protein